MTVTVFADAELSVTVIERATAVSSGVDRSAIDKVGAPSSSVIVRTPVASFSETLVGLLKVTVTVSLASSVGSASTATATF